MSNIEPRTIASVLLFTGAAIYLIAAAVVLVRRKERESAPWLLALAALIAALLQSIEALWQRNSPTSPGPEGFMRVQWAGVLIVALLLVLLVRAFLRRSPGWAWVGLGIFWLFVLGLLAANPFHIPAVVWSDGQRTLSREYIPFVVTVLGWSIFLFAAALPVIGALRRTRQPLYRNRLTYWLFVFVLLIANDVLILMRTGLPGNPLRLAALLVATYVVINHRQPDVRQIVRRIVVYIITALLVAAFYLGGSMAMQVVFRTMPGYDQLLVGAGIALVLALVFTPLLGLVQRLVERMFSVEQYDAGHTLREYSMSISNILDMERLASVAIGLIIEALEVERGFLFLVDVEIAEGDSRLYRLRAIRSAGERPVAPGSLAEDSPISQHFVQKMQPLLQYDLDFDPAFRKAGIAERDWFLRTGAEVYVPIFSNREWIGLLVLGSKLSGNRFTDEDLVTLSTLAHQTAVALENARLVENLVRLNKEIRQAYRALDKANKDLERLDRSKSDFISIASHELRTPLTVMRGYSQMLMEDTRLDSSYRSFLKGIYEGTLRLHEIMDSMFDIAQIDTRTLQLHVQPVDVAELVRSVCDGFSKETTDRQITLTIDLPSMPTIKADPNTLRKVFQHLVNNAIKFTPDKGSINIHGRLVPANQSDLPEGGIEVVVSDTGVGVDPEMREIIFTKFNQQGELNKHSTSKSRFKGSGAGLGLALSRGIVEAHGGRIWVESPGHDELHFPGSHFHVVLPLRQQGESATIRLASAVKVKL
jgi:signal transduction histidine kinase